MNDSPETLTQEYETIVIGAGPAGCEAALAAARGGAETLCLTINLDSVGFPPANPVIASGPDDPRRQLIEEIDALGGALPGLLGRDDVGSELEGGVLVADRRNLGLAYKELLESTDGVFARQSLVTGIEKSDSGWRVTTRFGEVFSANAVVIAAGTFLAGKIDDGGEIRGGGRLGEIPANALARALGELDIQLVPVGATNMPRLEGKSLAGSEAQPADSDYTLLPDGSQLGEQYLFGPFIYGDTRGQLARVREITGSVDAWMTRASWNITSLVLAAGQVDARLAARRLPGLFFAGRAAATCNYTEAATTGIVAGAGAAILAEGEGSMLIKDTKFVNKLCEVVAHQESRPVTIRIEGPGC